ncbi:MAG: hypothetical protein KBT20_01775 [Bacteroidales bacterium]|nr:hypothetical protein [Candidatus Liminaster caballi]
MNEDDIRQLIGEATEYDKKQALEVKKPKSWCILTCMTTGLRYTLLVVSWMAVLSRIWM